LSIFDHGLTRTSRRRDEKQGPGGHRNRRLARGKVLSEHPKAKIGLEAGATPANTLKLLDCLISFLKYDAPTLTYDSFRNPMGDKAFNRAKKRVISIFKPCHSIQARRF
jgi:hypothetical protein